MKLTKAQRKIIEYLKDGWVIRKSGHIGTRFPSVVCLERGEGMTKERINFAKSTYTALDDRGLLERVTGEERTYKLKENV